MDSALAAAAGQFLLRYGSVLVLFVAILFFVSRRWATAAEERRLRGIIFSAVVTIIGFLLLFGGPLAIFVPFLFFWAFPVILLFLVIPAFVAAALADLVLRALGATRTRAWLLAGIIAAVAITISWMAMVFRGALLFDAGLTFDHVVLALIPVSTALIWWAYLPPAADSYAETFE